ncbi:MAG: AzlD domain-containing protein [Nitriliruptor sp.]|nr:MAG: AzlD domain-containing protein [Nitriliruptor sp.]
MIVVAIIVLAVGTYACKAVGPLLAAGRDLSPGVQRLTDLLPAALLAALVATQTLATETSLVLDARVVGVGAAAIAVWLRAPFAIVVLVGAGVTALTRLLGWG